MADLIDRQAVNDALDKTCDIVCQYSKKQRYAMCGACPLGSAYDVIENVPATDAVEVVRCKDCKHYDLAKNGVNGVCNRQYGSFNAFDFCSYGERK